MLLTQEAENAENKVELLPMIDTYRNLTLKLLLGYKQALISFPSARWILKIDDDDLIMSNNFKYLHKTLDV